MGNASSNSDSDDYYSDAASEDGDAGVHTDSDQSEDNLISNLALLFKHSALRELAAKIRVDVPGGDFSYFSLRSNVSTEIIALLIASKES